MDMGQIIDTAIRVYRLNFGEFLAIASVSLPLSAAGAIAAGLIEDTTTAAIVSGAIAIPGIIISLIAQAAIVRSLADVADGVTPDFESAYRRVLPLVGRLLATALRVLVIVVALAITIVGIPFAIYFVIRWAFFAQAVIIEGKSWTEATTLSGNVVRGSWWRTLGILFVVGLLASLPAAAVSLIFSAAAPVAASLAVSVVGVIALPFSAAAETLLFFDLQSRERERVSIA
jgi:hypothetical protein